MSTDVFLPSEAEFFQSIPDGFRTEFEIAYKASHEPRVERTKALDNQLRSIDVLTPFIGCLQVGESQVIMSESSVEKQISFLHSFARDKKSECLEVVQRWSDDIDSMTEAQRKAFFLDFKKLGTQNNIREYMKATGEESFRIQKITFLGQEFDDSLEIIENLRGLLSRPPAGELHESLKPLLPETPKDFLDDDDLSEYLTDNGIFGFVAQVETPVYHWSQEFKSIPCSWEGCFTEIIYSDTVDGLFRLGLEWAKLKHHEGKENSVGLRKGATNAKILS